MYISQMDNSSPTSTLTSPNFSFNHSSGIFPPNSISSNFNSSEAPTGSGTDVATTFESLILTVVPVTFGSIGVLGFLGNVVVIATILFDRKRRSVTSILVLNLASADLVFIVLCIPFTTVNYVIMVWPFGSTWCKVQQYLIHTTAHASVYTLVLMSLDRYLAVVHPIRSIRIRTQRHALLVIAGSWLLLGASNSPMFGVFDVFEYTFYGQPRSVCINVRLLDDFDHARIFYGTFFVFAFALPLLLVSLLYGRLLDNLRANDRWRQHQPKKTGSWRTKRRVTRMVVVVVAVFGFCWLPLQLLFLLQFVIGCRELSETDAFVLAKIAGTCLAYANSSINPILYGFLSDNFRQSFRRLRRTLLECVSCGGAVKDDQGQKEPGSRRQETEMAARNRKLESVAVVLSS